MPPGKGPRRRYLGHESFVKHTLILANLVEGGVALADWPKEAAVSGLDPGLVAADVLYQISTAMARPREGSAGRGRIRNREE